MINIKLAEERGELATPAREKAYNKLIIKAKKKKNWNHTLL